MFISINTILIMIKMFMMDIFSGDPEGDEPRHQTQLDQEDASAHPGKPINKLLLNSTPPKGRRL